MNMHDDFERSLSTWIEEVGTPRPLDYLDEVFERTRATRQRPVWLSPGRWLPMQLMMPRVAMPRLLPILALVALLVTVLVVGALLAGSQRRLPPPFGLAAAGDLVYDRAGDLYLAAAGGAGARPLVSGDGLESGAIFSRDGTRVAYWSRPDGSSLARLWIIDADGRNAHPVPGETALEPEAPFAAVDWAPDNRRFALTSEGALYVAADGGRALVRLGDDTVARERPAWSPAGDLIAFLGTPRLSSETSVYVIAPDGTGEREVGRVRYDGSVESGPVWSPDGRIAYHSDGDIMVAERLATGWAERELIGGAAADWWPAWSNDGRRVVFLRSDTGHHGHLVVANADGTGQVQLPSGLIGWGPSCWSPDDATIRGILAEPGLAFDMIEHPRYVLLAVDGDRPPVELAADGLVSFGACSWQRLAR